MVILHCFVQFICTKVFYLFYSLPKDVFPAFRERKVGVGGGERKRNMDWLSPICTPAGYWACDLGVCPDQGWSLKPFGAHNGAPTSWATGPGLYKSISKVYAYRLHYCSISNVSLITRYVLLIRWGHNDVSPSLGGGSSWMFAHLQLTHTVSPRTSHLTL